MAVPAPTFTDWNPVSWTTYHGDGSLSADQRESLREAKAALPVPESLVETMAKYPHDPQALYAYRNRLAELIDRSGMPDADPWGKDFGVRGFATR